MSFKDIFLHYSNVFLDFNKTFRHNAIILIQNDVNMANYEKLYEKDYQKLLNKYDKKSDEYKLCKIFCRYKNVY